MAYSREQLMTALRNADAAGDTTAAKRIARMVKGMEGQEAPQPTPDQSVSGQPQVAPAPQQVTSQPRMSSQDDRGYSYQTRPSDAMKLPDRETRATQELPELSEATGILSNYSMAEVLPKAAAIVTMTDPQEIADVLKTFPDIGIQYDEKGNIIAARNTPEGPIRAVINKPGLSGMDVINTLGLGALLTPSGKATGVLTTALKEAAEVGLRSAAIQSSQKMAGGEFDVKDVLLDSALQFGFASVGEALNAGYRVKQGRLEPPTEGQQVSQFAKEQDLPLMTTDVVEPETFVGKSAQFTGERIPIAGTGGKRATQAKARESIIDDYSKSFGDYDPSVVVESLKKKTSGIKGAAGKTMENVKTQIGDAPVDIVGTYNQIDDSIRSLSALGDAADSQTIGALSKYRNRLEEGDITFDLLQQLRSQFRQDVKGERTAWPTRSQALVDKVYNQMTKDMDDLARTTLEPAEFAKWKRANKIYAEEANLIKNTRLKTALNKGDLTPENVNSLLYSNKKSEVEQLYNSLGPRGKGMARAGLITKAAEKAKGSPETFVNELERMSTNTGIFFKGRDTAYLEGLKKYINATRRAPQAAMTPATGAQNFFLLAGTTLTPAGMKAVAGSAGYGAMVRIYESAPVRNALLTLNKLEPGSTKFEQVATTIRRLIGSTTEAWLHQQESDQTSTEDTDSQ